MITVLFACVQNAGRSQMAAAFFNQVADAKLHRAISAGTKPADRVHPIVVEAMHEAGIDLSNVKPQRLTSELAATAQVLITMGCGDECPIVAGIHRYDWALPDPSGQSIENVRVIRDQIKQRVAQFIASELRLRLEGR